MLEEWVSFLFQERYYRSDLYFLGTMEIGNLESGIGKSNVGEWVSFFFKNVN